MVEILQGASYEEIKLIYYKPFFKQPYTSILTSVVGSFVRQSCLVMGGAAGLRVALPVQAVGPALGLSLHLVWCLHLRRFLLLLDPPS